jgi:mRNA-degrading endonuclease RelE of RelBE toxin-antitoxin system
MPVTHLKAPAEVRNIIRHLSPVLKRKVRAALADILEDPTCGKALKEELEGYWSLQVGRTRIIYRLTTAASRSSLSAPVKASMRKQREKFAEVRRRVEFFLHEARREATEREGRAIQTENSESNSRKKAALTLDIDG